MSGVKVAIKIILDLLVLFCVAFPLLAFMLWVEPNKRGFFLQDYSLRLPYKDETIPVGILSGIAFGILVVLIIFTEIAIDFRSKEDQERKVFGAQFPGWICRSYSTIGIMVFGAACQQLTTTIAKYVIGRLRPHFYNLCIPQPVNPIIEQSGYVAEYTCASQSGNNESLLKDMKLSFPSAHASFSMYMALFLTFYIQLYWTWKGSKLFKHGIQFTVILAAWYIGLSRITDHMHHWEDITVGFLIGAVYAILVFVFVLKPKKIKENKEEMEDFEEAITNQRDLESRLPRAILVNGGGHY